MVDIIRALFFSKAPATYAGDCGFSINATGMSDTQKSEFGKLLASRSDTPWANLRSWFGMEA